MKKSIRGESPLPSSSFALGYSRRLWARAYPHERLDVVLDGHERGVSPFRWVPLTCLYDNPRTQVLRRRAGRALWHPVFEDRRLHAPGVPTVSGADEGPGRARREVSQAQRTGRPAVRLLGSAECLARGMVRDGPDRRAHGTTHERPCDRFARETLTPLGPRRPYRYERVRVRQVPADALVAIAAGRYSVPVQYVGTTVTVHETPRTTRPTRARTASRAMPRAGGMPWSWSRLTTPACCGAGRPRPRPRRRAEIRPITSSPP